MNLPFEFPEFLHEYGAIFVSDDLGIETPEDYLIILGPETSFEAVDNDVDEPEINIAIPERVYNDSKRFAEFVQMAERWCIQVSGGVAYFDY